MRQYLDLLQDVLDNGTERDDRTGVGTIATFGRQIRFNMADGFPAVTTKALAWKAVVSELLWFLEGSTNEHRLAEIKNDNKPYSELTEKERKTIWTANYENQGKALGYTDGELGRIYGSQWVSFRGITESRDETADRHNAYYNGRNTWYHLIEVNQVKNVINEIKNNPNSRRLVVSAWNPVDLPTMSLAPCHYAFQFYVDGDKAVIECSPVVKIRLHSDRHPTTIIRDADGNLTHAEFDLTKNFAPYDYVRISIGDKENHLAWTNPIFLK